MEELREKVARAICLAQEIDCKFKDPSDVAWKNFMPETAAALRAIEEAGYDIVPQTDEGGHIIHRPLNLEEPRG